MPGQRVAAAGTVNDQLRHSLIVVGIADDQKGHRSAVVIAFAAYCGVMNQRLWCLSKAVVLLSRANVCTVVLPLSTTTIQECPLLHGESNQRRTTKPITTT
ncbi:hypothetical protein QVD17_10754 [Tagetes erecta]|uniref:Uncharacterized protein n=1 Tax=Tagetes erecta TaxID=13708 RepID=A0AAD8L761_TARER|nr:hypothetical protein QVD17_10754 [Tagetes erecta]